MSGTGPAPHTTDLGSQLSLCQDCRTKHQHRSSPPKTAPPFQTTPHRSPSHSNTVPVSYHVFRSPPSKSGSLPATAHAFTKMSQTSQLSRNQFCRSNAAGTSSPLRSPNKQPAPDRIWHQIAVSTSGRRQESCRGNWSLPVCSCLDSAGNSPALVAELRLVRRSGPDYKCAASLS